jgi:hypothetical protein
MANPRTEREILELLKAQKEARKDLVIGSKEYEASTKRINQLERERINLLERQKKAQKEASDVVKEDLPIYKQLEASIKSRLKLRRKLTGDNSLSATMQKKAAKQQGELLQSLQKQMVTDKGNELKFHQEQYDVIEGIASGTNDIAGLNQLIAESKERQKSMDHWSNKTIKKDEENTENILKAEKKRIQVQNLSKATMKGMDKISGGMASKAKDFGEKLGISPKNLQKLGVAGMIIGVLVKAVTGFSKKIDAVGETFGFMTNKNKDFRNDLIQSGNNAMMLGKSLSDVLSVTSTLASEFGLTLKDAEDLSNKVLDTAVATGLSTDEATKLFGTFMQIGDLTAKQAEDLIENTAQLAAQKGVAPTAVLRDMAGSAEEIAGFTKDGGKNIAEAAVQARQMGLSLSTTAKIAEGLLDFESSIANEIEASVMIGKQLNFQKARELALEGDIAGATKNIVDQVGSEAEFNKLNFLQRKSLAKSIGVSVTEMKKLVSASDKLTLSGALAGEKFDDLVGQDSLSTLTSIINTIKQIGATLLDTFGGPLAEFLEQFTGKDGLKNIKKQLVEVLNIAIEIFNTGRSIANTFRWNDKEAALKFRVDDSGNIMRDVNPVDDFKSGPGGITHMVGPAGVFSLNPKDSVLATTNRINDGFITGDEGSFANLKELVEAQRDSVVATTNPIPVNDFSLNPRDSVMETTNRINDFQTGPAGSMGNFKELVEAQRETTQAISNLKLSTTVTNRQQQIIIDGALNPLGGRPITA